VLDACCERDVKACRNEAGAAMMADAYGKATGRPGGQTKSTAYVFPGFSDILEARPHSALSACETVKKS
jgi:hypothetical protein